MSDDDDECRRSSVERETVAACFFEFRHLDFLCHSAFVVRHFHSNLNAPKESISSR
jgi:hypothetical protein